MKVLIIEGDYWQTNNVLLCLKQVKGVTVYLISRQRKKSLLYYQRNRKLSYHFPNEPDETFVKKLENVIIETNATVLLSMDEEDNRFVILHRDLLSKLIKVMPLPDLDMFDISRSKKLLANFMQEKALPIPKTIECPGEISTQKFMDFPFPALLKPIIGHAGQGIKFFESREELLAYAENMGIDENFILQEFIQGYDIGCYVLYKDGKLLCHTMQKALIPGRTVYQVSMGMEFIQNEEVIATVDDVMRALNWTGFANIDLRYNTKTGKVMILEINPRFSFTLQASLKAAGVNFAHLICRLAQNDIVKFPLTRTGRYVPLFVLIKNKFRGTAGDYSFSWKEIDIKNSFESLLPRLYLRYNKKR